MSKRNILNTTSTKKRNGMLSWSNTTPTGASQAVAINTAFVNATQTGWFVFQPTAMNLSPKAGGANIAINVAERTASSCYMRGFAEHLRVQTSSGLPWFHRRICFTLRGNQPFNTFLTGDTPTQSVMQYTDTSNGMERLWMNLSVNNAPLTIADQQRVLFKGTYNQDWNDIILAPVDTSRVDLKFDKTFVYRSGNAQGVLRERKLWHPMNKTLVYDDDEAGEGMTDSYFSTNSKRGMGDYYIVDIFNGGVGGTASDVLNVFSNSTLYWHER